MTPSQFQYIRAAADLTQEELAEILGVSSRQIINYEDGTTEPKKLIIERMLKLKPKKAKERK